MMFLFVASQLWRESIQRQRITFALTHRKRRLLPMSVTHGCHGLGGLDKAVRISHEASELGTTSEAFLSVEVESITQLGVL